jgi:signal transduction histidine kinase
MTTTIGRDEEGPGQPWIARTLAVLLALVTLTVAVTSLVRTARSFYKLDFTVTWMEDGVRVNQVPAGSTAQASGLAEQDLIVAVDGVPVLTLEDPIFALAGGEEHQLLVLPPNQGEERRVMFRPPPPEVDTVYLARSAVGIFGLACAVWAIVATRRREATTFLLLAAASLVVGAIPHRTAETEQSLRVLHRVASAAIPFLVIRFFAIFPERRQTMRLWDVLTVTMLAAATVMTLSPNLEVWWPLTASGLRVLFALGLISGTVLLVSRWWAGMRVAHTRRQIEWVALGMFVGLMPFATLVLLPRRLGIEFEPFDWLTVLPIAAVPLGFLAALTGYRLWDLEPISRDSISATVAVIAGGLVFAAINRLVLAHVAGSPSSVRNLLAFATGVLLVVLLQPMRLRVERFLDQWLHHGRPTPRWLMTHATRDLVRAIDPRELLTRFSETLHEALELELVATYLRTGEGPFARITGSSSDLPAELPPSVVGQPFPAPPEQDIRAAGYAQRIPLERMGTVHGLLYLGLRRGIFPLGTEGREVVTALAAQTALGLESARLLDNLRRQAEEYRILHANTQRIIESSAAGILVCDATGRILSTNARAAAILDEPSREMVGIELRHLVELPASWQPHLPLHAVNAEGSTRGEAGRRVVMAVSVLELDSGSFNGRVVVLQDVSELRDLQDRLREQERLASLGRLASGLAHEINTPLTGIASYAQMLGEMTPEGDPRAELVSKLVGQSFRVSRIVSNLREAVRGSSAELEPLDLVAVSERAAVDAARAAGAAERLEISRPDGPVSVWGAPGAVELAISNLVRNALEASPGDRPVLLRIRQADAWGEAEVEDHGPGIPQELHQRVFEPFFSTKTERGGTGLGLAITRDMIGQLGGEVTLSCPPEGGTRATIRLPRWEQPVPSS